MDSEWILGNSMANTVLAVESFPEVQPPRRLNLGKGEYGFAGDEVFRIWRGPILAFVAVVDILSKYGIMAE